MTPTTRRLDASSSQWVVQALARLCSTYAVLQGFGILLGGRRRWSGPSFEYALQIPGAPHSWGWALLVVGLIGLFGNLFGQMRLVFWSMTALTLWFWFFTISLMLTAAHNPDAATTGIITYAVLGVVTAVLGAVYKFSKRNNAVQEHTT